MESEAQEARSLNCQWLRSDAQVVYVALQGHVRLAEAGVLRELMQALDDRPPKTTYLDLQGIQYIDSTGLGLLTAMHKRALENDRDLVLVAPPATVLSVLRLSKLDRIFEIILPEKTAKLRSELLGSESTGETLH